jgi:lipoprotein-anchoring transpeptidase ErfK/SrfK
MRRPVRNAPAALLAALLISLAACGGDGADADGRRVVASDGAAPDAGAAVPTPQEPAPPREPPDLRLEVDVSARELYVYRNDERIATHPVAVGTEEWPTRRGEWTIGQVVWNPRWVPPTDESWAEEEEVSEPGDPENPLGRAQLVYDAPRSIHGTNEPASLGKAASHGSIRVSNDVATRLARMVMESGGAERDEAFYTRVRDNRSERVDVPIPNPVPIRVVD